MERKRIFVDNKRSHKKGKKIQVKQSVSLWFFISLQMRRYTIGITQAQTI
jgi:hypothetical protein